ncbi:DUF547 domain-containing protein [Maribacter sp. HTCC2170]|uniref:DUF547 domain-containing protein n=1 Tax=Maribacter sp. (strain HTCC2170 / KCCM 42371) TaxID=313603 RepID=UPI00006AE661|nr:DUF547 domain-containing protein [Maribacter sp. HTCC2170]EAR00499.1 hypothetical protein FB2170_08339 [Maribacter sp. HTCC2170]
MYRKILVRITFLLAVATAFGQDKESFFSDSNSFFKTNVENGRVNYKSILDNPSELNAILLLAKEIRVSKEDADEYQTFWINGYNLLVIKSIIDNYPVKSPLDKAGFFDVTSHDIGGEQITLNDIEHKMLRAVFPNEPRFHFVLVCAGLGCPPIINKAYLPNTLNSQLEEQTKYALNDPNFIRINKNKVKISQIFEWYKGDFTKEGKSLLDYINQFRTKKLPEKSKVSYYPYNWALNEIK